MSTTFKSAAESYIRAKGLAPVPAMSTPRPSESGNGAEARARIEELLRQLAEQQAEVKALETRLKHSVEITIDKQHEFASVAQAEGVSLSVARRLLRVMTGPRPGQGVATLGRATLQAARQAGPLLAVLDEMALPQVKQGTADEIFSGPGRP